MKTGTLYRSFLPEIICVVALAVAPYLLPMLGMSTETMDRVLIFGLFGLGFDLLFGYTGLLSFGQAALYGTGGFVTAYLLVNYGMSSVMLALFLGTLSATAIGVLIGMVALRRTGIYFAMITVAIAEMFFFLENNPLAAFTGGENGIAGVPSPSLHIGTFSMAVTPGLPMYAFLALFYFVGLIVARRIVRSPVGHILVAIRDNPLRAAAVGHNVARYKLLVFVIASAYGGLSGGLLGILQGYMPPEAFTFDTSGQLVIQTVIGGPGTLYGPLVGAAVWLFLRDFLQGTLGLGAAWRLALGVIFVLLVCFLRRGVIGGMLDLAGVLKRKKVVQPPEPDSDSIDELIQDEPELPPDSLPAKVLGKPLLQTTKLTRRYGGLVANRDIDFVVREGELRGIIGPNGAGKSTFFKMLTCEVQPSSGTITFDGSDVTGFGVTTVCQLGLTKSYQVNQLFARLTVRENLIIAALAQKRGSFKMDIFRNAHSVPGVDQLVDECIGLINLTARADVAVSELAYGEKRRLEIGLALATQPRLLLLDEPLAGMSPRERVQTVSLLKSISKGRTMVVIDHDMDAIFQLAETITVLAEGAVLVEGTPTEIRSNPIVQEVYLGGVHDE